MLITVINIYESTGDLSTKHSGTHLSYGTIIPPLNLKLESWEIVKFMGKFMSVRGRNSGRNAPSMGHDTSGS